MNAQNQRPQLFTGFRQKSVRSSAMLSPQLKSSFSLKKKR
jgi:hypothetical protein